MRDPTVKRRGGNTDARDREGAAGKAPRGGFDPTTSGKGRRLEPAASALAAGEGGGEDRAPCVSMAAALTCVRLERWVDAVAYFSKPKE